MGTFITDKLQHLNNDLVQLFHLDTQALVENTSQHTPTANIHSQPHQQEPSLPDHEEHAVLTGLRSSIDALDLRSGVVPTMEKVLSELEKVQELLSGSGTGSKDKSPSGHLEQFAAASSRLQHLFLAKCTVAVYLNLLRIILNATLPLANEIEYWQSLLDQPLWRLFYILQTSPNRLLNLTKTVALSTRNHIDSLIESSQKTDHTAHLLQLLQFFPSFLKNHLVSRPVSLPEAIHYEITGHRKQLQKIREYQAECLGLLAEQGLNLDPEHLEESNHISGSSTSLAGSEERLSEETEKFILEQISKTVSLMERVLEKASADAAASEHKGHSKNASRSLTMIGNLQGLSNLDTDDMYSHLKELIQIQIPRYVEETENQSRQFYRPSWIARVWIPVVISYFGLKYGLKYISDHRADLDELLEEAWDTAKRFVSDWVWEPSMRIMAIIRHQDDQGSLQMLGNKSLQTDIASLERMVLDFGREHYRMGSDQLDTLSQAVHNGDISVIMRAYEQELKTPLKGAVTGHLVQTLLIQIQKTKVDVEVAMAALDKLLKANELNFAFLAVGPSLLLLWAVSSQAKSTWHRLSGKNLGLVSLQMRNSLRQVERLLNLASTGGDSVTPKAPLIKRIATNSSKDGVGASQLSDEYDDVDGSLQPASASEPQTSSLRQSSERVSRIRAKKGKVPYRTQGLILCEVHLLRAFARQLTRSEGLQDKVMEDLREIEESSLTVHQRLRTTKRMYRTYGFLGLYH